MTLLQIANIRRLNLKIGINDFYFNMLLMLFGKATTVSLAVLPMTIMMTYVVPKNIEASMFALITGALTFSTDWGGDMIGALLCEMYGITEENMTNFDQVLTIRIACVAICILLTNILPTNQEVYELSDKMQQVESTEKDESCKGEDLSEKGYLSGNNLLQQDISGPVI